MFRYSETRLSLTQIDRAVAVETPEYDLTIFKIAFGLLGLKMYSKGERVLRIEATAHNTKALKCGRVLEKLPDLVQALHAMVVRLLETLRCVDVTWVQETTLDDLPISCTVGRSRLGGIYLHQARTQAVFHAVSALSAQSDGFTAGQVAENVGARLRTSYTVRQASYDLKKLRGKNLIRRIDKSHRYQPTQDGLRTLVGLLTLRDKILQPLLAYAQRPNPQSRPKSSHPLDCYYEALREDLQQLFAALNFEPA